MNVLGHGGSKNGNMAILKKDSGFIVRYFGFDFTGKSYYINKDKIINNKNKNWEFKKIKCKSLIPCTEPEDLDNCRIEKKISNSINSLLRDLLGNLICYEFSNCNEHENISKLENNLIKKYKTCILNRISNVNVYKRLTSENTQIT